jgi:hypothetical protein
MPFNDDGTLQLLTEPSTSVRAETCSVRSWPRWASRCGYSVFAADTERTPVDIGSWISGLTYVTGNAVKKAAQEAKLLLLSAAKELEVGPEDLELRDCRVT